MSVSLCHPRSAIVLLRTPFQAWVVEKVLARENIEKFSLVYVTQDDSDEDRYYFRRLAAKSEQSQYCHVSRKKFDVIGDALLRWKVRSWFLADDYDLALFSSINSFVLSALAMRKSGLIVTFDDGTANVNPSSIFHVEPQNVKARCYRLLFGTASLRKIKNAIQRHYTLHPDLENIVEKKRISSLTPLFPEAHLPRNSPIVSFFIGAPFREVLTGYQVRRLLQYIERLNIDYYVKHPREIGAVTEKFERLDKNGQIAEEAIIDNAKCARIHLIGCYSTVMLNMRYYAWRRTMIVFSDDPNVLHVRKTAQRIDCEIVVI